MEGAESKLSSVPAHWLEIIAFTPYSRTVLGLSMHFYCVYVPVWCVFAQTQRKDVCCNVLIRAAHGVPVMYQVLYKHFSQSSSLSSSHFFRTSLGDWLPSSCILPPSVPGVPALPGPLPRTGHQRPHLEGAHSLMGPLWSRWWHHFWSKTQDP